MVGSYNFFILEVLKAWIDPQGRPENNPSLGRGNSWSQAKKSNCLPNEIAPAFVTKPYPSTRKFLASVNQLAPD